MAYADYDFYKNTYHGNTIAPEAWLALAITASAYIDQITFCRLKDTAKVPDSVRMAVCAVAEAYYAYQPKTDGIKSETVDGYNVTYEDGNTRGEQRRAALMQAADLFLPRCDPLRFVGVNP